MTQRFHTVPSEAVLLTRSVASVALVQWHQISNTCLPESHVLLLNKACHHKTGLTRKGHLLIPFLSYQPHLHGAFASICRPSSQLLEVSSWLTLRPACIIVSGFAASSISQPTALSELREIVPSIPSDDSIIGICHTPSQQDQRHCHAHWICLGYIQVLRRFLMGDHRRGSHCLEQRPPPRLASSLSSYLFFS